MQEVFSAQEARVQSVYGYDNPEFQELAEMQAFIQDESERQEMIARTQQILAEDVLVLPLVYPYFRHAYRKGVFDAWYFTPRGFAVGAPPVYNKQAFVTGQQEGTEIRTC